MERGALRRERLISDLAESSCVGSQPSATGNAKLQQEWDGSMCNALTREQGTLQAPFLLTETLGWSWQQVTTTSHISKRTLQV